MSNEFSKPIQDGYCIFCERKIYGEIAKSKDNKDCHKSCNENNYELTRQEHVDEVVRITRVLKQEEEKENPDKDYIEFLKEELKKRP